MNARKNMMAGLAPALVLSALGGVAQAATVEKEVVFDSTTGLSLENLVGKVTVRRAADETARVRATVVAETGELAASVSFDLQERDGGQRLLVVYPENVRRIHYKPENGSLNTTLKYQGHKVRVTSRDRSDAVALRVDLEVLLPAGARMNALRNGVGDVDIAGVDADLRVEASAGHIDAADGRGALGLDTGSGSVTVTGQEGHVRVDTGSGSVVVTNVVGDVDADTGSGSVRITGVSGDVTADTGSGSVTLEQIMGDEISADTGSGSVRARDIRGSFNADTGSGSVHLDGLRDADRLAIDTGSGSVYVRGALAGLKRLGVDTGSGDVELRFVTVPDMRFLVEVSSGRIKSSLPDLMVSEVSRSRMEATAGSGSGRGVISTGSGDVTLIKDAD